MTDDEIDLVRFGAIVRTRREELGIQQEDMDQHGGPSSTTMSRVERGIAPPSPKTLRKLDAGLSWVVGSAQRTLAGGDPTPLPDARDFDAALARARMKLSTLHHRRSQKPDEWTDDDDRLRDQLDREVATLVDKRALAAFVADRSNVDVQQRRLIDLWVLAQPLTQPGLLDPEEVTDSAVELAREVSAYTESLVGGYTKMQNLAQAAREADDRAIGQGTIFEEDNNAVETETPARASAEGHEAEEANLLPHEVQLQRAARAAGRRLMGASAGEELGVDRDQDGEHGHELGGV